MWWDVVCAALGVATIVYLLAGRRRHSGTATRCRTVPTSSSASRSCCWCCEAVRRTSGWIIAASSSALFLAYGVRRPVASGTVGASRLRRVEPVGLHVPDARRHFRHRGRRVVVAHHPVHDLRRLPPALRAPASSISTGASPRWAASTAGAGRTVVLASFLLGGPSGSGVATTVTIGSVAYPMLAARGLRQGRGGRPARRRRPGRDHLAAGAGRRRVPDRRVPEDQLSRRAADGDGARRCSTTCRCS